MGAAASESVLEERSEMGEVGILGMLVVVKWFCVRWDNNCLA